jgi:hypothetical protein
MTSPGAKPGRRGEKPAINRLSYGTAIIAINLSFILSFPFLLMRIYM